MAQALMVLEKHGIIHRDIKTKNIFVTAEGSFKLGFFFFFFGFFSLLCFILQIGDYSIARIGGVTSTNPMGTEFGFMVIL
jgi:serine/threonine protein kinase